MCRVYSLWHEEKRIVEAWTERNTLQKHTLPFLPSIYFSLEYHQGRRLLFNFGGARDILLLKCPDRDILRQKCPDRDILQSKMSRSGHFRLEMGFITKMSRSGHFSLKMSRSGHFRPEMGFVTKMSQSGHFRGKSRPKPSIGQDLAWVIWYRGPRPSNMLGLGQDLALAVYLPNIYVLYMYMQS